MTIISLFFFLRWQGKRSKYQLLELRIPFTLKTFARAGQKSRWDIASFTLSWYLENLLWQLYIFYNSFTVWLYLCMRTFSCQQVLTEAAQLFGRYRTKKKYSLCVQKAPFLWRHHATTEMLLIFLNSNRLTFQIQRYVHSLSSWYEMTHAQYTWTVELIFSSITKQHW
jgi:hypothetical protein